MSDAVRPVLLVVSRSARVPPPPAGDLRRYDRDYDVVTAEGPDEARERLAASDWQAAGGQAPVALLLARCGWGGLRRAGRDRTARRRPGSALRVPAVRWGDFDTARPIFEALTLGQLDRWSPCRRPIGDEEFHRAVTEILEEWRNRQSGGFEAVRIIGRPVVAGGPSTCATRSPATASRWGSTTRTRPRARPSSRGWSWTSPGCPSSSCGSGRGRPVAAGPERPRDRRRVRPAHAPLDPRRSTTWWSSAPARPAWPPPSTPRRRACARWCVEPEAVGGQAGTSSLIRNYLGFPRGVSGDRARSARLPAGLGVRRRRSCCMRGRRHLRPDGDLHRRAASPTATTVDRPRGGGRHRRRPTGGSACRSWRRWSGAGVFYGAAVAEAPAHARPGRLRRRRRQLGRPGRAAPGPLRRAGDVLVRRADLADDHVRLPDPRDRGAPNIDVRGRVPRWSAATGERLPGDARRSQDLDTGERAGRTPASCSC